MSNLAQYVQTLQHSIAVEQGTAVSALLSFNRGCSPKFKSELLKIPDVSYISVSNNQWRDIIIGHLRVLREFLRFDGWTKADVEVVIQAASDQISLVQQFHQLFMGLGRWSLPILYVLNKEMRDLCMIADQILEVQGKKRTKAEEAVRTTYKAFSYCATDRYSPLDSSRKWGTYAITNLLFKTYFFLNTTNLCLNIFRALAASDLPPLEQFPKSHQVTFSYYKGVLLFTDEKYKEAEEQFLFAFEMAQKGAVKNKRQILKYLLPLRLARGIRPQPALLKKYDIPETYMQLIEAAFQGDVSEFLNLLDQQMETFIKSNTYFLFEKLEWICFRTLFRETFNQNGQEARIPYDLFLEAWRLSAKRHQRAETIGVEDLECVLANLIDRGYMKGYLSNERHIVVLSKADPFPSLQNIDLK